MEDSVSTDTDLGDLDDLGTLDDPGTLGPMLETLVPLLDEAGNLFKGMPQKLKTSVRFSERHIQPKFSEIQHWCLAQGILEGLTIKTWFRALLRSAKHITFDDRMVVFTDEIIWGAKQFTFFELLRRIPIWFHVID